MVFMASDCKKSPSIPGGQSDQKELEVGKSPFKTAFMNAVPTGYNGIALGLSVTIEWFVCFWSCN
jgi:hypothetical protein